VIFNTGSFDRSRFARSIKVTLMAQIFYRNGGFGTWRCSQERYLSSKSNIIFGGIKETNMSDLIVWAGVAILFIGLPIVLARGSSRSKQS
jgi:hypothetical protein